jgi:hypothetical protein
MNITHWRGSSLVDLANDQSLLAYCAVVGDERGPPVWVQLMAHADHQWPALERNVVRLLDESVESMFARVMTEVRNIKRALCLLADITHHIGDLPQFQ